MPYKDIEKQKEAQARYYRENKVKLQNLKRERTNKLRLYIQEIKSNTPCTDCGIQYPSYIMDFDHIPERGKKEYDISNLKLFSSIEVLKQEIEKCEVVCSNCHRHRSWMRLKK